MTFPPIDTGAASDTTPKPNQLAEISEAISKIPFPDLPDKALEITNGVTPNGNGISLSKHFARRL
jgi:hypothetical protein